MRTELKAEPMEATVDTKGLPQGQFNMLATLVSDAAADIMGNDHLRHRLDEQQSEEVHGHIQDVVLKLLVQEVAAAADGYKPPAVGHGLEALKNALAGMRTEHGDAMDYHDAADVGEAIWGLVATMQLSRERGQ